MNINEEVLEQFFRIIERVMSEQLEVKLSVIKDKEYGVSASIIKTVDNDYLLTISSGLFDGIIYKVAELTKEYDDNDYLWFSKLAENDTINFMNRFIDLNDIEEHEIKKTYLINLFTSLIIQNVIFHESAHIIGKHLNSDREYLEYDGENVGNIEVQCKEMFADYVSTKVLLSTLYSYFEEEFVNDANFYSNYDVTVKAIRHIFLIGFLTLYFQFDFKSKDTIITFDTYHPHKKVRLLYCLLSFRDEIIGWIKEEAREDQSNIEEIFDFIFIKEIFIYISSFLGLSNLDFKSIMTEEVVNHYFSLVDYSGEKTNKGEVGFLSAIDESYKHSVKNFIESVSSPNLLGMEWYKEISNALERSLDD